MSELIASSYFVQNNFVVSKPINDCRRSITVYPDGKPKSVTNRFEDFEKYKVDC